MASNEAGMTERLLRTEQRLQQLEKRLRRVEARSSRCFYCGVDAKWCCDFCERPICAFKQCSAQQHVCVKCLPKYREEYYNHLRDCSTTAPLVLPRDSDDSTQCNK